MSKRDRPKKLDPIIERIELSVQGALSNRHSYEQGWYLNQLFYQGFQWNYVDALTGDVTVIPQDIRFRSNLILPAVQAKVAKLTASQPDWDVESEIENQGIQNARYVAEKLLEWVWDDQEMPYDSRELVTSMLVQGTGHIYVYWDDQAGDPLSPEDVFPSSESFSPEDVARAIQDFGGEAKLARFLDGVDTLYSGGLRMEVISCFDFHVDPSAVDEDSARWMMVSKIRSVAEVEERFPQAKGKVQKEDINKGSGPYYRHRVGRLVNPNVSTGAATRAVIDDGVVLNEYWERPSREHPEGLFVVYANDKVLHSGPNPYVGTAAELPFVRFRDVIINERYWGGATTDHAINIQLDYNKAWSDLIKNRHDHGANKWLVPRGAGLLPGAIDRETDEVIEYNAIAVGSGAPLMPQRVPPGIATNLHTESMDRCKMAIDDLYGIHEVSRGNAPTGVTAMGAIQLLQAADDQKTGPVLQELYRGYARVGRMVLDLFKVFADDIRTFRSVVGNDSEGEIIDFTGADLSNRAVRVKMGSLMGRSRAYRQQGLLSILQYAGPEFFENTDLKRALMNVVGLRADMVDPNSQDRTRAIYENKQMEQGEVPRVEDYDDHQLHLAVVEQRMKELSFDRLPPQVQAMFRAHREAHLTAIQEAAQSALEMQAAAAQAQQGGGGGTKTGIGIGLSGEDLARMQQQQLPVPGLQDDSEE